MSVTILTPNEKQRNEGEIFKRSCTNQCFGASTTVALTVTNSFIRSMGQRDKKSPGIWGWPEVPEWFDEKRESNYICSKTDERNECSVGLVDSLEQHTGQVLYSGRRYWSS